MRQNEVLKAARKVFTLKVRSHRVRKWRDMVKIVRYFKRCFHTQPHSSKTSRLYLSLSLLLTRVSSPLSLSLLLTRVSSPSPPRRQRRSVGAPYATMPFTGRQKTSFLWSKCHAGFLDHQRFPLICRKAM